MVDSGRMDSYNWTGHVDVSKLCRVCALQDEHFVPIFEGHGLELEFQIKLLNYLSLKVSQDDILPLQVCLKCSNTLLAWHDLVTDYKRAEKDLWSLLGSTESRAESEVVLLDEDSQDSVKVVNASPEIPTINLDDLLILPGKPTQKSLISSNQPTDDKAISPKTDEKARHKEDGTVETQSPKKDDSTSQASAGSGGTKMTAADKPVLPRNYTNQPTPLKTVPEKPIKESIISGTRFKTVVKPFILSRPDSTASKTQTSPSGKMSTRSSSAVKPSPGSSPAKPTPGLSTVKSVTTPSAGKPASVSPVSQSTTAPPVSQLGQLPSVLQPVLTASVVNPAQTVVDPALPGVNPLPAIVNTTPAIVNPVQTGVNPVSAATVVNPPSGTSAPPQLPTALMLAPTPGSKSNVITLLLPHNMISPANNKLVIRLPVMPGGSGPTGQTILVPNALAQSTNQITPPSDEVMDLGDNSRGPSPCPSDTTEVAEESRLLEELSGNKPVTRSLTRVEEDDPISIVHEDHKYSKSTNTAEGEKPKSSQKDNKKTVNKLLNSLKKKNEARGCFVCGKIIANPTLLSQHERSHFKSLECISYNCSLCSKSFNNFQDMVSHRMEHEKPKDPAAIGSTPSVSGVPLNPGIPMEMPTMSGMPTLPAMPQCSGFARRRGRKPKEPKEPKKRKKRPRVYKPKPKPTEDDIDDQAAEGVDLAALAAGQDTAAVPEGAADGAAEVLEPGEIRNFHEAELIASRLEGAEVVVLDDGSGAGAGASVVVPQEVGLSSLILASQEAAKEAKKKKKELAASPHIKCPICNFCFKSKLALVVHKKRKHTPEEQAAPYQCKECGKRFRTSGLLKTHVKIHGDRPGELCFECGKIFKQRSSLVMHRRKHHDVPNPWPTYPCEVCPRTFDCRQKLSQHMNVHSGERPYCCEKCGKSFYRLSNLKQHSAIHLEERPFICETCGMGFKWLKNLNQHSLVHKERGPVQCEICNKTLNGPVSLKVHKYKFHREQFFLENPGVERIPCQLCSKVLSSALNLENHMKKYHPDGQQRFACDHCGKRFTTKINRDAHVRAHTGERPYACTVCPKTFTSMSNLHAHKDSHTDERPWPCSFCDKTFKRKAHLDAHNRSHTGEKPYLCEYCNRGFAQSNDRNKHRLTHTKERPFRCNSCGDTFRAKRDLTRHIEKACAPGDVEEEEYEEEDEDEEGEGEEEQEEIDFSAILGTGSPTYVTYQTL